MDNNNDKCFTENGSPLSCSNGYCLIGKNICACNNGYTNIGDFHLEIHNKFGCFLNITLWRLFWGLALIPGITATFSSAWFLYRKRHYKSHIKKLSERLREPLLAFPCFVLISGIAQIVLSILKLIDPVEYAIGVNLTATIFNGIDFVAMCFGANIYYHVFSRFILGITMVMGKEQKARIRGMFAFIFKVEIFAYILPVISAFLLPILCVVMPIEQRPFYSTGFLISFSFYAVYITIVICAVLGICIKALKEMHYSDGVEKPKRELAAKDMILKFTVAFCVVLFQGIGTSTLFISFGLIPTLFQYVSYLIGLMYFSVHIVLTIYIISVWHFAADHDRSSKARSQRLSPTELDKISKSKSMESVDILDSKLSSKGSIIIVDAHTIMNDRGSIDNSSDQAQQVQSTILPSSP